MTLRWRVATETVAATAASLCQKTRGDGRRTVTLTTAGILQGVVFRATLTAQKRNTRTGTIWQLTGDFRKKKHNYKTVGSFPKEKGTQIENSHPQLACRKIDQGNRQKPHHDQHDCDTGH